jgi:hypothetical protein
MMRKTLRCLAACFLMSGSVTWLYAQERVAANRCGTMEVLESNFKKDPELKARFDKQSQNIQKAVNERKAAVKMLRTEATITYVPIVFHIVLTNPSIVSDAQIQAQLNQLNTDFAGMNGDSSLIPAAFKPLFAKARIQFKLAQRTPNDEPSNGIVRTTTSRSSFGLNDASVKYTAQGGDNAWDRNRFYNVWITDISYPYLGYATFPNGSSPAEDGVVIDFTTLPGGTAPYNRGRTLVHETGHYFYLFHIWGDDDGCESDDAIKDTPGQAAATSGCPGGVVKLDACSRNSPGILYEDYMDYTDDACMVMFTTEQVLRMETSLSNDRSSLFTSNGADPVILYSLDASAKSINIPLQRVCTANFSPIITLRNKGSQTISSATIYASIDNGAASVTNWTGSLASLGETAVTLNSLTSPEGVHILKIVVSSPNGNTDEDATNDTITTAYQYFQPLTPPVSESFESSTFPLPGWDIINPDLSITWERTTRAAKTGNASIVMRSFDYPVNGQKDYIRMPVMNIANADSAFLTFQVAAAVASNPAATNNPFDTLEVLASSDCGATFTSLYKKWGSSLITRSTALNTSFVPTASEWRKDSVNLTGFINKGPLLLAFVNNAEYENNIYLDDINVYSVSISENLKKKGFMITPNPTTSNIAVQFYPNPAYVKGINIFNSSGQKVAGQLINGAGSSVYNFDLRRFASGVYVVQVVLGDKVITQKVIKR